MAASTQVGDSEFAYDVAISFHGADEALAAEIADLLQDRFRTFIYSNRQDILAGRDGEEGFGEVFFDQARIVVVLCRPEWGQTPFTRIEETAIRNHAFNDGYDFTLFVPTTEPAFIPKWLPRTRLYFGLARFGMKGLAAVIERLIEERGGIPRVESVADRAARFQREEAFKQARATFNKSAAGVQAFGESAALMDALKDQFEALRKSTPALSQLVITVDADLVVVSGRYPVLVVERWCRFSNSLDGAKIVASFHDGFPNIRGRFGIGESKEIRKQEFTFDMIRPETPAFVSHDGSSFLSEQLGVEIVKTYLDLAEKHTGR
jgi:hypothetical protein